MKIEIDWTRCAGHGVCSAALPELIVADQWGFPQFVGDAEVPIELARAARTAVATCPAVALRLRR